MASLVEFTEPNERGVGVAPLSHQEPVFSGGSGYTVATTAELFGEQDVSGARSGQQPHNGPSKTYEQLESELKGVRIQLQAALNEKEEIRQEWKQATRELNKLQAERNFTLNDDFLATEWKQLRWEIKAWAYEHFDGELKSNPWTATEPPKSLTRLVSNLQSYIRSSVHRPLLVQAFVWNRLQRDIFSDETRETFSGLVWAGTDYMKFTKLHDIFKPKAADTGKPTSTTFLKEFHRWRALTSWLLDNQATASSVETRMKPTVQFLDQELALFATSNIETQRENFRSGLSKIVAKATRLDADFQKQRAVLLTWGPVHPQLKTPYGYAPIPGVAEDNDDQPLDDQRLIELVVVPALCKRGNAEGEDYDKKIVLVKCRATQDRPPSPKEKDSSSFTQAASAPPQSSRAGAARRG